MSLPYYWCRVNRNALGSRLVYKSHKSTLMTDQYFRLAGEVLIDEFFSCKENAYIYQQLLFIELHIKLHLEHTASMHA